MKDGMYVLMFLMTSNFAMGQKYYNTINWDKYEEPEGKYSYLNLSPALTISKGSLLNFGGDYYFRRNTELLVQDASVFGSFYRERREDEQETNGISISPRVTTTKYLKKRRGLFLEMYNSLQAYNNTESDYKTTRLENYFAFGVGRLEDVSTLYQSNRILGSIAKLRDYIDVESNEEKFELAIQLKELDYLFLRDFRVQRKEKEKIFLDYFKNKGIDMSDTDVLVSLLDGYRYSRQYPYFNRIFGNYPRINSTNAIYSYIETARNPITFFREGQTIKIGVDDYRFDGFNTFFEEVKSNSLFLDLRKSISVHDRFRVSAYSESKYHFKSDNTVSLNLGARCIYVPSDRTFVTFSYDFANAFNAEEKISINRFEISSVYFINYNTTFNLHLQWHPKTSSFDVENGIYFGVNRYFY